MIYCGKRVFLTILCLSCFWMSQNTRAQSLERVVVGESSDADKLNPLTNFSATGSYINEYLFFSLLRTDKATGDFVPLLAYELPEISTDELSYTYRINSLARFNNGKKITADDVIFSLKMAKNPFVNNSQKSIHYSSIQDAEAIDDLEVVIRLAHRSPQGLRITSDFAILAKDFFDPDESLDDLSFAGLGDPKLLPPDQLAALKVVSERINGFGNSMESFNGDAISGPYLLQSWKRGEKIELIMNKKFWGRKGGDDNMFFSQNVGVIEFRIIGDEAGVRSSIFQAGVDVYTSVPPDLYFELSDIPRLRDVWVFHSPPQNSYEYVGMNMRGKERGRSVVLGDVKVRTALAHLLDVEGLLDRVRYGLGERIAAEYPSYRPEFQNKDLPLIKFDPAKGKALLKEAGWEDTDGNGFLDKVIDGERTEMVLECIYNQNRASRKVIAEALQNRAREAGILISNSELAWTDYLGRLKKGDFDLAVGAWVSDPNEDSYAQIWHSKNWGNGSNFIGFGDRESDALVEAYDGTVDSENRKSISMQIQRKMHELQPYIFLWANTHCIVVQKTQAKAPIYNYRPGFWIGEWK